MSSPDETTGGNIAIAIVSVITVGVVIITVAFLIYKCCKLHLWRKYGYSAADPPQVVLPSYCASNSMTEMGMHDLLNVDVLKNRPVRFSSSQLQCFTRNYADKLGSGGFGVVYKGHLPNSLPVAVKVLSNDMGKRAEEQFMAEIGTIARTSHVNLVGLYGFCFDADLKALVYEWMANGSLERYLFDDDNEPRLGFDKLYDIAVGTAKAIRYLHDECARRIVHYDIKPGNVLLDEGFKAKVADFGLAKLCDREKTHVTATGARGTPGYTAPELWMPVPVTPKCDVYSYGMLLFEMLGRRRNMQVNNVKESEEWYPQWVWRRLEIGEMEEVVKRAAGAGGGGKLKAERICKVALLCVQYRAEERPSMSSVVQMLEGEENVVTPTVSPFAHLEYDPRAGVVTWTSSSTTTTRSS